MFQRLDNKSGVFGNYKLGKLKTIKHDKQNFPPTYISNLQKSARS